MFEARQYEQSIQELRKALELYPDDPTLHLFLGRTFSEVGRHDEAIAETRQSLALQDHPVVRLELARILARAGKRQQAKGLVEEVLKTRGKYKYLPPPVLVYGALGEKDRAFALLEKEPCGIAWPDSPLLDPLRSDPRSAALLRKMNPE